METKKKEVDLTEEPVKTIKIKDINKNYTDENVENIKENEQYIELENKYKYLLADFDNVKKRYNKTLNNISNYREEFIIQDLLDLLDNLERNNSEDEFINLIKKQLNNILSKYGVKPIYNDRPTMFNSDYDEAVASVEVEDKSLDNSISDIVKKGYFYKDKIIRYEQVIVNKVK